MKKRTEEIEKGREKWKNGAGKGQGREKEREREMFLTIHSPPSVIYLILHSRQFGLLIN